MNREARYFYDQDETGMQRTMQRLKAENADLMATVAAREAVSAIAGKPVEEWEGILHGIFLRAIKVGD